MCVGGEQGEREWGAEGELSLLPSWLCAVCVQLSSHPLIIHLGLCLWPTRRRLHWSTILLQTTEQKVMGPNLNSCPPPSPQSVSILVLSNPGNGSFHVIAQVRNIQIILNFLLSPTRNALKHTVNFISEIHFRFILFFPSYLPKSQCKLPCCSSWVVVLNHSSHCLLGRL